MDKKDSDIIRLLQNNGKLSYAQIGDHVDLSITPVKERIKKLLTTTALGEMVYIPNPKILGFDICAFVQVLMPVPSDQPNFIAVINAITEIQECHLITGEYSYLLKIRVRDIEALEKVLDEEIKTIPGVNRINTIMALTTSKESLKLNI